MTLRRAVGIATSNLDTVLLAMVTVLLGLGLTVLYSASNESIGRVSGQIINIGVACAVMWMAAKVPPNHLMRIAVPAYVFGLALLVAVALFGEIANGARRWLHIGVTRIQPSELMKIAVPMMLAWYFHRFEHDARLRHYAIAALILAAPVGLIVRQPDLGTAILIGASGFYVLFLAGLFFLGRSLLLGLEFLVAGDIIKTVAVEPTFDSVIVLAIIVLVRTVLSISIDVEIDGRWPWAASRQEAALRLFQGRGASEPPQRRLNE